MQQTASSSHTSGSAPRQLRVALFGKSIQPDKCGIIVQVVEQLQDLGVEVFLEKHWAELLAQDASFRSILSLPVYDCADARQQMDFAVSMGGDGTFLSTAEKLGSRQVPILGVNMGRLGFLADVKTEEVGETLRLFVEGKYTLSQRSLIEVHTDEDQLNVYPYALNEVAVLKHDNSSLIEVETRVDGNLLTNYVADGLVVSTPTGSTGYALSVGGPVLAPESPAFCLAAVAPHSLTMRPIVLSDDVEIVLRVKSRTGRFLIALDGRSRSLKAGTTIRLRKAPYQVAVVKTTGNDFFHTLREKMMWGVDQRN